MFGQGFRIGRIIARVARVQWWLHADAKVLIREWASKVSEM